MESKHADTLNALHEMQQAAVYALRRRVLADAERIIVEQEKLIADIGKALVTNRATVEAKDDALKRLRTELQDALDFLLRHYAESQADFETPPEPADAFSYEMGPLVVSIREVLKETA